MTPHQTGHQTGHPTPFDLPAAAHSYLARAAASLQEAMATSEIPMRYACAHVAALRATAALLAARATPALPARRGRQQKNAWVLLAEIAPELSEWAAFFAAGATKRAAAESGSRRAVTEREADDLVRDADRFLGLVEESLGMTRHVPVQEHLPVESPQHGRHHVA
jgi:SAV_6107-like HEPN